MWRRQKLTSKLQTHWYVRVPTLTASPESISKCRKFSRRIPYLLYAIIVRSVRSLIEFTYKLTLKARYFNFRRR